MKSNTIIFCHDTCYFHDNAGKTYVNGAFPYKLWQERFLPHYGNIIIIGRKSKAIKTTTTLSNGANVTHILLDNINSPAAFLTSRRAARKTISSLVKNAAALVIRGPSEFGMIAAREARRQNKPYAVEMSGCAFNHTWHHGTLTGKLYAPVKYFRARHMISHADQILYVTRDFLQKRYPSQAITASASNVEIAAPDESILETRREKIKTATTPRIGLIGNHGNKLKGIDIAIKALSILHKNGQDFHCHILGDGDPQRWQPLIRKHSLTDKITFHAPVSGGEPVLQWLDQMDIYIQPSRHEGLPRALIEAMSRALPCLASNAGGTAELLRSECIHKKGSYRQLAQHITSLINDKEKQALYAIENFATAQNYTAETLTPIRHEFYKKLKERSGAQG
jgi:glycosyltransferase involved in cell wall biosynthesis